MGNKLRSPTQIGHLLLSDSSTDDYLYVQGIPIGDYPTITVAVAQIIGVGNDAYTTAQYIRFTPTQEQAAILANNNYTIIKLDLTALGNSAPAPYVWLRRNTVIALPNPLDPSSTISAYQFTCGGEQFWYDNYATDIAIKNIGNAALVYAPALGSADITLLSISVPDLWASIPVPNPTGTGTVDLTKLQVGNTIYNIPTGGKLYQHHISTSDTISIPLDFVILTSSQNAISKSDFLNGDYNSYLYLENINVANNTYGIIASATVSGGVISLDVRFGAGSSVFDIDNTSTFSDTVTEI